MKWKSLLNDIQWNLFSAWKNCILKNIYLLLCLSKTQCQRVVCVRQGTPAVVWKHKFQPLLWPFLCMAGHCQSSGCFWGAQTPLSTSLVQIFLFCVCFSLSLLLLLTLLYPNQGPRGPEGPPGERGLPGEGLPGPKVTAPSTWKRNAFYCMIMNYKFKNCVLANYPRSSIFLIIFTLLNEFVCKFSLNMKL